MTIWKSIEHAAGGPPRPALFLDRDGVVIEDRDYLADPAQVRILPGVIPALDAARRAGFLLVGVSNQSGIGRGYFSEDDFRQVMSRLQGLLADGGAGFDSFHYCPHAPDADCACRKPRQGLMTEARSVLAVDPDRSWMIGDKASDVAFGRGAGLGCILVRTGYGKTEEPEIRRRWAEDSRVLVADDLPAAVAMILALAGDGTPGQDGSP